MRRTMLAIALATFACASTASAQGVTTLIQNAKGQWDDVKGYVLKAAEQMSEADYAFQPTDKVRTFGQIIAHLADDNTGICAMAIGDKSAKFGDNEKTKKTKAELVAALKASVDYCDSVFAKMDEKTAVELREGAKTPSTRLSVLLMNTGHVWEHYGNIITYMRLKGLTPPSSQGSGM